MLRRAAPSWRISYSGQRRYPATQGNWPTLDRSLIAASSSRATGWRPRSSASLATTSRAAGSAVSRIDTPRPSASGLAKGLTERRPWSPGGLNGHGWAASGRLQRLATGRRARRLRRRGLLGIDEDGTDPDVPGDPETNLRAEPSARPDEERAAAPQATAARSTSPPPPSRARRRATAFSASFHCEAPRRRTSSPASSPARGDRPPSPLQGLVFVRRTSMLF